MPVHPLRVVRHHFLVELPQGPVLIDTGSPFSLKAPEVVREFLGVPVTHIMGCDELAKSPFRLDSAKGEFEPDATVPRTSPWRISSRLGVPMGRIIGPAGEVEAMLDTGAWLSYAAPTAVRGFEPVRTERDFLVGMGSFETPVYRLPVTAHGEQFELECGVLPVEARGLLAMIGLDGWIVGSAFFQRRAWVIDLGAGEVRAAA